MHKNALIIFLVLFLSQVSTLGLLEAVDRIWGLEEDFVKARAEAFRISSNGLNQCIDTPEEGLELFKEVTDSLEESGNTLIKFKIGAIGFHIIMAYLFCYIAARITSRKAEVIANIEREI